jgi:putative hydrolase of the HAD superfamily
LEIARLVETIEAIIFDFGGVISHPQDEKTRQLMSDLLNINHAEFIASYSEHRHPYDTGLLTGHQYWTRICTDHAIDIKTADILKLIELDVNGWTDINRDMLAYILLLQNSTIKTAVLSNMTFDILNHIQATYPWINNFNTSIFSCEHQITKPDKRLYKICIKALQVDPANCLFIDDTKQNIVAAQELGIQAIQFLNEPDFSQKIVIHCQF